MIPMFGWDGLNQIGYNMDQNDIPDILTPKEVPLPLCRKQMVGAYCKMCLTYYMSDYRRQKESDIGFCSFVCRSIYKQKDK